MRNHEPGRSGCKQCPLQCMFAGLITEKDAKHNIHIREIQFRKGENIFKQGSFGSKVIFIKEGLVKLIIEGDGNRDLLVKFFTQRMYLGIDQLNGTNESKYTVTSLKDTKVCMIEINFFKRQSLSIENLKERIFDLLAFENEFLRKRLLVMGTKNNLGRLTNMLLYLTEEELVKENIYKYITRRDLADLSDMSVESLERLLGELKRDGIIKMNGKLIEIINLEMIKAIARAG